MELTLKEHWGALVMGVVVGVAIIAPQIIFMQNLGSAYQGIYMLNTDAELHYVARMENALHDGGIGNPFVVEYRNNVPSGFYSYSEEILVAPARVLPISVPTLNLIYKFLLPAILALLVYAFVFRLTYSRSWSIVGMTTVVLGSTALNIGTALNVLHFNLWYEQFLLFSRPVNPIFSLIVFFIFLQTLLTTERRKSWEWFVGLGALFGLAWYIYIYLATTILALLALLVALHVLYKRARTALQYLAALSIGLLLGGPGIASIAAIPRHPYYDLFVGPIGLTHTHMPYLHMPWLIVTGLFLLSWYHHRAYEHARILCGLLLAALVVVNQQVLTGLSLHPGHYLTYFCIPIYIVVLCTLGYEYLKTKPLKVVRALQCVIGIYVVLTAAFIQYSSYTHWAPLTVPKQRYAPVLAWLQSNTPPESVVMADEPLSELIAAYTRNNVMWEAHANSYLMPQERWDFTPTNALTAKDFCSFIRSYRLDFIVREDTNPSWEKVDRQKCVRPLAQVNGFTLYAVQK